MTTSERIRAAREGEPYYVRAFDSATGYTYWQVMGPFGRKFESLDRSVAVERAARLNEELIAA